MMFLRPLVALVLAVGAMAPAVAEPLRAGEEMVLELVWQVPVDLDLFVTGPEGETIYFGNRMARLGHQMIAESDCTAASETEAPYIERAQIPIAYSGTYRASIDFIKHCGAGESAVKAALKLMAADGTLIEQQDNITVEFQQLNTVAWEFEVK